MSDPALTIDDLRAEVTRLQVLADARLYRARAALVTLESVGIPRSEPVDVGAARAAGMIEDLRAEVDRLTAALAAAQAAPVVGWHRIRDFDRAEMGYLILTVHSDGWTIRAVDIAVDELATLAEGDEGGDAGKAACEAAYRRAVGWVPPRTVCPPVAPQVIPLRQAYEGTTVCLHCGKPQPGPVVEWRTRMDVEEATVGAFALLVESDGWRLEVSDGSGDYWIVDSGDETGPAGKAACEAAYRRACAC